MKKLHLYKMYTPRDVSIFILRKEKDIIKLLEEGKAKGIKLMGYWYVRGSKVIEIQKLMREVKHGKNSSNRSKSKRLATEEGQEEK